MEFTLPRRLCKDCHIPNPQFQSVSLLSASCTRPFGECPWHAHRYLPGGWRETCKRGPLEKNMALVGQIIIFLYSWGCHIVYASVLLLTAFITAERLLMSIIHSSVCNSNVSSKLLLTPLWNELSPFLGPPWHFVRRTFNMWYYDVLYLWSSKPLDFESLKDKSKNLNFFQNFSPLTVDLI